LEPSEVTHPFDARPIVVVIAGPNGAGKSTFYEAFLSGTDLRFVNADNIARLMNIGAYDAADLAEGLRQTLVEAGESFVFETVFSDPAGAKVAFLSAAHERGYHVALCFIGLDSAATSDDRVAMRVLQGGHDVPVDKVRDRYVRSLDNLARAIVKLPLVWVYDNADLNSPFRKVAEFEEGRLATEHPPIPVWFEPVLKRVAAGA
jgi:predicted ABC-type ATPase